MTSVRLALPVIAGLLIVTQRHNNVKVTVKLAEANAVQLLRT